MRSMSCCGGKKQKYFQQTSDQLRMDYGLTWRFKDDELFEFTKRFESYAVNHKLSHKNYRESLGIIGIESLSFLCDRMFQVMDKDKDNFITLPEYLNYIDVLLYGTEDEKLKQSFELLDEHGTGHINFYDFRKIVSSFAQMWSAALGQPTPINPRWIEKIFHQLAINKDYFNLNDFIREMRENPDMLFWFSKPEKAMNKRMNDHLGQQELKEQMLKERIEVLRDKFASYQNQIQIKLQQVIEIITGVTTPEKSKAMSHLTSPAEFDSVDKNRKMNTWQFKNNNLFMNLNSAPPNDIEFPNRIFENINASPRVSNRAHHHHYHGKHHHGGGVVGNGHKKNPINHFSKSPFPRKSYGSIINNINQQQTLSNFDIIEEEPRVLGEERADKIIRSTKQRQQENNIKHNFASQGRRQLKKLKSQTIENAKLQLNNGDTFENGSGIKLPSKLDVLDDQRDNEFEFDQADGDSQNARDQNSEIYLNDYRIQYEGGDNEEVKSDQSSHSKKNQKKPSQIMIKPIQRNHTEYSSLDKTINENDINLDISNLNETRTMNNIYNDHNQIQIQNNPMYPGQIFFVESPTQIEYIDNYREGEYQDQVSSESSDFDSSQSSSADNESENLKQFDENLENFDLTRLDKKEQALIKKLNDLSLYLHRKKQKPEEKVAETPKKTNWLQSSVEQQQQVRMPHIHSFRNFQGPSGLLSQRSEKKTEQIKLPISQSAAISNGPDPSTTRSRLSKVEQKNQITEIKLPNSIFPPIVNQRLARKTIACQTESVPMSHRFQNLPNQNSPGEPRLKNGESILTFADHFIGMNDENKTFSIANIQQNSSQNRSLKTPKIIIEEEIDNKFPFALEPQIFQRRINIGKKLLNKLVKFVQDSYEPFDQIFRQLLNIENPDDQSPKDIHSQQVQVIQNVPKTDNKKNKILKPKRNIPDNVKLIHPAHENFNLVFNIMLGIKRAIDSTLDIPLLEPTEKDFKIKCKYEMAPFRTSAKDNIKACTFYDYAPQIFASIRKTYGIKKAMYSNSLGPDKILGYMFNANFQTLAELCSSGKSGSFFYYTSDGKFVLKTISRTEFKFLQRILQHYHQYLTNENPESIISKVYGLHKVIFYRKKKAKTAKKVYFTIMNNVFNTNQKIDKRYDLKGSTQGRRTLVSEEQEYDPTIALKDLDFLAAKEKFKVGGEIKKKLLETITKDAKFFAKCDIIDYSLLIGVHYKNKHQVPHPNGSRLNSEQSEYNSPIPSHQLQGNHHLYFSSYDRQSNTSLMTQPLNELCEQGILSIEKSQVYFIGIIDILTEYNTKKKLEHAFKSIKYNGNTISCVPPEQYADRFIHFIKDDGATKFMLQQEGPLFRPEFGDQKKEKNEKLWELMGQYLGRDIKSIQKSIVGHVEYTLAMTRFSFSNFGCCQAVAYSLRDRMIECFNDTNQYYLHNDVKRVYFMSMEYILGRQMQSNLLNNDLEQNYREALKDIGYDLKQLYEEEIDINLGYGVLGRIAADSIDSLATQNFPCWAYGMRYDYGIFRQELVQGEQVEIPDYWLERGNPWEIERPDITYKIRMYGRVRKTQDPATGQEKSVWEGGECILASAYDMPTTGYNTFNTNNLRLWRSRPYDEYEESLYENDPDYFQSVEKCQESEYITSIFYPNDKVQGGKELRLKQQYFYATSSLQDIFRRFKKHSFHQVTEFDVKNAIYLHETHAAIAILETLRILIDEHEVPWQQAWNIVYHTFSCGFYTIKESQMEKWPVDMFGKLLPRHLELVYMINHIFLEKVKKFFPPHEHVERLKNMSLIEETNIKQIRIANLCIVACHKVVLCSELQFEILTKQVFKDFYDFIPKTFILIPNGANPRRWIYNANRNLSKLITEEINDETEWLVNLEHLKSFNRYTEDLEFLAKFLDIRAQNKQRLLNWIKKKIKLDENPNDLKDIMFDFMVKRVDENKRQLMYLLYIIYRYNKIKSMEDKSNVVPRYHFIGGKTAIGNLKAKQIVKLINQVATKINEDPETKNLLRLIFIPNYNASKEHIVVPAADFNEQISLPGEEACTTISEKFILNGALIIGSKDSTNTNIAKEIGQDNITMFGVNSLDAKRLFNKEATTNDQRAELVCEEFKEVVRQIDMKEFGECHPIIMDILHGICNGQDPYLIGVDFKAYIQAHEEVDQVFKDKSQFCKRIVSTLSNLGNLQIDKTIRDLCSKVWNIPSVEVPKPALNATQRVRSWSNLLSASQEFNRSQESLNEMDDGNDSSNYAEQASIGVENANGGVDRKAGSKV